MLRLDAVSFGYASPLLESCSLSVPAGTCVQVLGENGAGKTTLLRLIAGVLAPASGRILWHGERLRPARVRIGYLPAGPGGMYPRLTALQNMEYFAALAGIPRVKVPALLRERDPFGIDYWQLPVENLSQGMRQRVRWVRALLHDPELLLLDEPLNALDEAGERRARETLATLAAGGKTLLVAQHGKELSDAKLRRADRRWEWV